MLENNFYNKIENKELETVIPLHKLEQMAFDESIPRKKVVLIEGNVPNFKEGDYDRKGYFFHSEDEEISDSTNLGIHRIAGYLDKYKVPVELIRLQDFNSPQKQEELMKIIDNAEIIGMSALSPSIEEAFKFCAGLKKKYPEKMIIGGAQHFALDYEWILKNKDITGVDACCTMQGELTILALALGVPEEEIGSLAYAKDVDEEPKIINNKKFSILNENCEYEVGQPAPARPMDKKWTPMIFPEMIKSFKYCGSVETGTGCPYPCEFCTNKNFLGQGFTPTLETAKQEINNLFDQDVDFVFIRNALLNANPNHLKEFLEFMKEANNNHINKMGWFAFMSVQKNENQRCFKEMADAGCVMMGVGVEDVVGKREELQKGSNLETAIDFIDSAKNHVLIRTLLIMGLAEHYKYSREEIKETTLGFMKKHPQGMYRLNLWTPIVGTEDFKKNNSVLERDVRKDVGAFKEHDTMHSVVDPKKMYDKLEIPEDKRWVKDSEDWVILRNEIIKEYLESEEHKEFLEGLKDKENLGKTGLLYNIALDFQQVTLDGVKSYGK